MNAIEKIALTKIKGIGPKTSRLLLAYCGSLEEIFKCPQKELKLIPGLQKVAIEQLISKAYLKEAEEEYQFMEENDIQLLWFEDENYPARLKHCEDAPLILFQKGNCNLNHAKSISIVGTRNATSYGRRLTEELVHDLKELGVLVVSGLAYGIDIMAHRSAMHEGLETAAVLAHGLDRIYPFEHREIAEEIIRHGCLLSEYPSGTTAEKTHFPMRNRIVAGLSDVTVVMEAANKGGALITADIANSYNRDVCAFPGSVDLYYSAGCNELIRSHKAHLIRNAKDLLNLMQWDEPESKNKNNVQLPLIFELTKQEQRVFDYLKDCKESHIDDIAAYCEFPQSKLAMILLEMEMNGIIQTLPGKRYKLP
ncbi:MAG: DNA-processing protein DprA [Sphingobacterium mizutaii]|nr:DNA-processing protein DprA [Sphingobacterium mizutaii]